MNHIDGQTEDENRHQQTNKRHLKTNTIQKTRCQSWTCGWRECWSWCAVKDEKRRERDRKWFEAQTEGPSVDRMGWDGLDNVKAVD